MMSKKKKRVHQDENNNISKMRKGDLQDESKQKKVSKMRKREHQDENDKENAHLGE